MREDTRRKLDVIDDLFPPERLEGQTDAEYNRAVPQARGVALLEAGARLGQLDEDEVAELLGGVLGDADGGDAVLDQHPLVVFGEFQHVLLPRIG